jgi:hypothetical protein
VELVTIGGDLTYGRTDWITALSDEAAQLQPLIAWGQPMLLGTGFVAEDTGKPPAPAPTLAELRAALIGAYPQVGPIFV